MDPDVAVRRSAVAEAAPGPAHRRRRSGERAAGTRGGRRRRRAEARGGTVTRGPRAPLRLGLPRRRRHVARAGEDPGAGRTRRDGLKDSPALDRPSDLGSSSRRRGRSRVERPRLPGDCKVILLARVVLLYTRSAIFGGAVYITTFIYRRTPIPPHRSSGTSARRGGRDGTARGAMQGARGDQGPETEADDPCRPDLGLGKATKIPFLLLN